MRAQSSTQIAVIDGCPPGDVEGYMAHIARVPVPLAMLDLNRRPVVFSQAWIKTGVTAPGDMDGAIDRFFNGQAFREACERCIGGVSSDCQVEAVAQNGEPARWWMLDVTGWARQPGAPEFLLVNAREVTDTVRAVIAATRAEQRLSMALKLDRSLVHERDLRSGETVLQSLCPELEAHFVAANPFASAAASDRARLEAAYGACAVSGAPFHFVYRLDETAAPDLWIEAFGERYQDMSGGAGRIITVFKDVSERQRQQKRVEDLAYTDTLTGLSNRAAFQTAYAEAVAGAERGEGFGVVVIDLDYFKQVNDTFGHDAGDALLKSLAGQLRRAFRQSDTIARLGGDEFAMVLRDLHDPSAILRPIAVLENLLTHPLEYGGQTFTIGTSIGAAFHAPGQARPQELLKNADLAMYEAKVGGRGRAILFQDTMRTRVEEKLQLLRDVRRGLAAGEFSLAYHPIIDLGTGRVEGLEALVRWSHPQLGELTPGDFGAAFDDADSASALGDFAFETALEQIRTWLDAGLPAPAVSINVSVAQLRDGRIAREIQGKLKRWGVPGERLAIEVNETMARGRGDDGASQAVRQLAAAGLKITLDNFGVGQGSLGNRRDYPVDRLKIAKPFVANLDAEVVTAIVRLGRALDLQVVADGVEGEQALNAVRALGCVHAQGFHFSRPMAAADATRYLWAQAAANADGNFDQRSKSFRASQAGRPRDVEQTDC